MGGRVPKTGRSARTLDESLLQGMIEAAILMAERFPPGSGGGTSVADRGLETSVNELHGASGVGRALGLRSFAA